MRKNLGGKSYLSFTEHTLYGDILVGNRTVTSNRQEMSPRWQKKGAFLHFEFEIEKMSLPNKGV